MNVLSVRGKSQEAIVVMAKLREAFPLPHLLKAAATTADMFWLL